MVTSGTEQLFLKCLAPIVLPPTEIAICCYYLAAVIDEDSSWKVPDVAVGSVSPDYGNLRILSDYLVLATRLEANYRALKFYDTLT